MSFFSTQNPGIGGLDELTLAEEAIIDSIGTLTGNSLKVLRVNAGETAVEWAATGGGDFLADGSIPMTGDLNFDGNNIDNGGVIFLKEQAEADADVAGSGQLWVDTATPNILMFTNDAGTDFILAKQGAALTASEIVITDASGYLVSAAVATYPSLTELSYVKGVTSAIQTQIGGKIGNVVEDTTPQLGGNLDAQSTYTIQNLVDPTNNQDAATKAYVDAAVGIEVDYFFNDTASDIGGIYYAMTDNDLGGGESTLTKSSLTTGNDQALYNFATLTGGAGLDELPAGVYDIHFHAERTAGTRTVNIYAEIYSRTSGGSETLRMTSETSSAVTSKAPFTLHANLAADVTLNTTDRLVVKFYANVGATGSDVDIALYQEGTTDSHLTIQATTDTLSNIFVRQDGTSTMSGNLVIANAAGALIGNASQVTTESVGELQVLGTDADGADASLILGRWGDNAFQPQIDFIKSRNATIGSSTIVQDNDNLGGIHWHADDGTDFANIAAAFFAEVDDASPAANDIGTAFVWEQEPGGGGGKAETMRLTAAGALQITGLTASEIVGTNASKQLVSLAVATYPSLTELAYVKGVTSAIQTQLAAKLDLAGGTLTGNINLGEAQDPADRGIVVDSSLSADERYSGITIPGTAGATIAFGDLCYLDATAGEWLLADADAVGTAGSVPLGICVDASTDGAATSMLMVGSVRSAAFPASVALGAPLYVSTTAGDITATAPTGADDVVRVVGFAITTEPNTIYFNPSPDHITVTG